MVQKFLFNSPCRTLHDLHWYQRHQRRFFVDARCLAWGHSTDPSAFFLGSAHPRHLERKRKERGNPSSLTKKPSESERRTRPTALWVGGDGPRYGSCGEARDSDCGSCGWLQRLWGRELLYYSTSCAPFLQSDAEVSSRNSVGAHYEHRRQLANNNGLVDSN